MLKYVIKPWLVNQYKLALLSVNFELTDRSSLYKLQVCCICCKFVVCIVTRLSVYCCIVVNLCGALVISRFLVFFWYNINLSVHVHVSF